MKTLIKISTKLLLVLLFVSLTNCENEEFLEETERFTVKTLNDSELRSNNDVYSKVSKYNKSKKNNSNYRSLQDSTYNFTINTDNVNYVIDNVNNTHSYTFPLNWDVPFNDNMYNLLLKSNSNNSYDAYIVKYEFSLDQFEQLSEDVLNNTNTKYYPIDYDFSSINLRQSSMSGSYTVLFCVDNWVWQKIENDQGNLNGDTPLWTWGWVIESTTCNWVEVDNLDTNFTNENSGGDQGDNYGDPTNGGNTAGEGNGDNSNPDDSPIVASPSADYATPIISCINSLGDTDGVTLPQYMVVWLLANQGSLKPYSVFLSENNCSVEAQQQVADELTETVCVLTLGLELTNLLDTIANISLSNEIQNFLIENNNSCESYQASLLYAENYFDDIEEFSDYEIGPDCESFNFQTTTTDAFWQNAAVKNIRFRVVVLSPQGNYVNFDILYSQPILFGVPTNMVNGGNISSGLAAELSAQALSITMGEVVAAYGNQLVTELQVRLYFEQRLKHNYPIITNGGRVTFNPMMLPVVPTEYETNFFGTGNCD